ncbi:hypothetical protein K431DRAFT_350026 [Polychaeton citri CBS 116435]|uniref:Telomere-associated protein Rif1 N-terminal domain-containing protein n=1 Tax=Polychaeton citri CBS 116435 TaxID=1314669 RepID=A0A9P4Q2G7_9PEZI|nr:hypothetical protein K431DRAFT_350026 [Polychaeton citri CBS 116435]
MSPSQSKLDHLPARPPTPPRDIGNIVTEAIEFLDDSNEVENALAGTVRWKENQYDITDTPHSTPASDRTKKDSSPLKKVGFSLSPTYAPAPSSSGSLQLQRPLKARNTNDRRPTRPLKSILKPQNQPIPPTPEELEAGLSYFSPDKPSTFEKMLQSTIYSLAGTSRSCRLDAYLNINAALKAHEGVPDKDELEKQMARLQQFLARDISWKDEDGKLDANIVQQALKLAATLLHDQILSKALDDDFKSHLLDRSITVLESLDLPKIVVKHHAYLLGWQMFPAQLMSANRADRTISAFQTIEQRCSGNSVLDSRLTTYQRLLDRQPNVMLARMRDWIKPVVKGMFHPLQSIRERAIETCVKASLQLGEQPSASKVVLEYFESKGVDDKRKEFDEIVSKLNDMLSHKENTESVPQIWAALTLFLRSKRRSLDSWARVQAWLRLIQRCLNSTDLAVKREANRAWNQFVFVVMPDSSSSPKLMEMLSLPITVGLQKKRSDKNAKYLQAFALNSLYNLVHYAFRPGLSYAELDFAWDTYIGAILPKSIINSGAKGQQVACRILQGLFSPSAGAWDAHAAFHKDEVKPQSLPRIDPKWLRSRLAKVLVTVEPLIATTMWSEPNVVSLVNHMWLVLTQAVADAGSQEVRISTEMKEALAAIMGTMMRIWKAAQRRPAELDSHSNDQSDWIRQFGTLFRVAVTNIGSSNFREEILARSHHDEVKAAPTPSHRSSKHHYPLESPVMFVTTLFLNRPVSIPPCTTYFAEYSAVLKDCVDIDFMVTGLQLLVKLQSAFGTDSETRQLCTADAPRIWSAFAGQAVKLLLSDLEKQAGCETNHLGQAYRNVVSILEAGLHLMPTEAALLPDIIQLFQALLASAKYRSGYSGVLLAVLEPVSKCLSQLLSAPSTWTYLELTTNILSGVGWPQRDQSIQQGQEVLWGISMPASKAASAQNPYEHLYTLIRVTLLNSRRNWKGGMGEQMADFLSALSLMLKSCPCQLILNTIDQLQDGLVAWLNDPLTNASEHDADTKMIPTKVADVWQVVLELLDRLPERNSTVLHDLEALFIAGFTSMDDGVAIASFEYWNRTYGQEDALKYPVALSAHLKSLRHHVSLRLPNLPIESDEDLTLEVSGRFERKEEGANPLNAEYSWRANRPAVEKPFFNRNKSILQSPSHPSLAPLSRTRTAQKQSKLKLRHEDSQIDFAPINEISPTGPDQNSQMLTDHQKEVRDKQGQEANMFPDISSSPVFSSAAPEIHVHRKLDFVSAAGKDSERAETPVADVPAGSDFLGSSPTPRASRNGLQKAHRDLQLDNVDDNASEIPSSPPKDNQTDGPLTTLAVAQQTNAVTNDAILNASVGPEHDDKGGHGQHGAEILNPDQLEVANPGFEVYMPQDRHNKRDTTNEALGSEPDAMAEEAADRDSSPIHYSSDSGSEDSASKLTKESFDTTSEDQPESVSRIEESFVAQQSFEEDVDSPSNKAFGSDQGRKRKRSGGHRRDTKKQKAILPFKRFFSSLLGQSQEEKDDGSSIEDEIVVASSCPYESPHRDQPDVNIEEPESLRKLVIAEEKIMNSQTSEKPAKRGQGRPRKTQTPSPAPRLVAPAKKLKRKASTLSQTEPQGQEQLYDMSAFNRTETILSSSRRIRKQREGTDAKLIGEAEQSQDLPGSIVRRTAIAVVPSPIKQDLQAGRKRLWSETDGLEGAEADEGPVMQRRKATPKSIFGMLKSVLDDLRVSILGSQEERQIDDILFAIRRESHEAARRGRDG